MASSWWYYLQWTWTEIFEFSSTSYDDWDNIRRIWSNRRKCDNWETLGKNKIYFKKINELNEHDVLLWKIKVIIWILGEKRIKT